MFMIGLGGGGNWDKLNSWATPKPRHHESCPHQTTGENNGQNPLYITIISIKVPLKLSRFMFKF